MSKGTRKESFKTWLNSIGFKLRELAEQPTHEHYYLALGITNRGIYHCVVALKGKTVHDPHPSQEGLLTIKKYWSLDVI